MAVKDTSTTKLNNAASLKITDVRVIRWRGAQHPTFQAIAQQMEREGLRPYAWSQGPNCRDGVKSHGYSKVLYCVEGALEVVLPDAEQRVMLRPGDRLELPRGVRHSIIVGPRGARGAESVVPAGGQKNPQLL